MLFRKYQSVYSEGRMATRNIGGYQYLSGHKRNNDGSNAYRQSTDIVGKRIGRPEPSNRRDGVSSFCFVAARLLLFRDFV